MQAELDELREELHQSEMNLQAHTALLDIQYHLLQRESIIPDQIRERYEEAIHRKELDAVYTVRDEIVKLL